MYIIIGAYLTDTCTVQNNRMAYLLHRTMPAYCLPPIDFIYLIWTHCI